MFFFVCFLPCVHFFSAHFLFWFKPKGPCFFEVSRSSSKWCCRCFMPLCIFHHFASFNVMPCLQKPRQRYFKKNEYEKCVLDISSSSSKNLLIHFTKPSKLFTMESDRSGPQVHFHNPVTTLNCSLDWKLNLCIMIFLCVCHKKPLYVFRKLTLNVWIPKLPIHALYIEKRDLWDYEISQEVKYV